MVGLMYIWWQYSTWGQGICHHMSVFNGKWESCVLFWEILLNHFRLTLWYYMISIQAGHYISWSSLAKAIQYCLTLRQFIAQNIDDGHLCRIVNQIRNVYDISKWLLKAIAAIVLGTQGLQIWFQGSRIWEMDVPKYLSQPKIYSRSENRNKMYMQMDASVEANSIPILLVTYGRNQRNYVILHIGEHQVRC